MCGVGLAGIAMKTRFSLSCTGWMDDSTDEHPFLTFALLYTTVKTSIAETIKSNGFPILESNSDGTFTSLIFPSGDVNGNLELAVTIQDPFGELAYTLINLKVSNVQNSSTLKTNQKVKTVTD